MSDLHSPNDAVPSFSGDEPLSEQDSQVACAVSPEFPQWLAAAGGSLAVTTYQAGKVALIGWDGRQITLLMRDFPKPLGMAVQGSRMALVTRHELCMFANAPARRRVSRRTTQPLRRVVFAAGLVPDGRFAHSRHRVWRRASVDGQHALQLPGAIECRFQFRTLLATAIYFGPRPGRPLPSERIGDATAGHGM